MVGCFGSHLEDQAIARELDRHLDKEAEKEARDVRIKELAAEKIKLGGGCHPWTFEHFTEAIENAPENTRMSVFCIVAAAVDIGLKNDNSNHLVACAIKNMVEVYWERAALNEAREEVE